MNASTASPFASTYRYLLLPGWQNSGETHWQSEWERQGWAERVDQDDWEWPKRGDWMSRLEDVVSRETKPMILVAHSLGCHLVTAWAAHSQNTDQVAGAVLVAPPDLTGDWVPPQLTAWKQVVRDSLPFPSMMIYSINDPYGEADASVDLANAWGCDPVIDAGAHGHLNSSSGLGLWANGQRWVGDWIKTI